MIHKICLAIVCVWGIFSVTAQRIHYDVSFPNLVHHEAEITITVTGSTTDKNVFVISRSSPGRYDTHPFGNNIYHVTAQDENGKQLTVEQQQVDEYLVPGKHDKISLHYTLFANFADGTHADIDPSAILLNIPASFMWVKHLEKAPIEVKFNIPAGKGWTIATQMMPGSDSTVFTARDLPYFMDCPVLIGNLQWRSWQVTNPGGKTQTIRLALNGDASEKDLDEFAAKLQHLVKEEQAVFGELPAYDHSVYTFLANIHPWVHNGDGMEHRNSTVITSQAVFNSNNRFISTFAHEFFHGWNVERIRPASLEPFDFTKPDISEALWFAEGFTQYYGSLIMVRAGQKSVAQFAGDIQQWIAGKNQSPGGTRFSPLEISRKAVFTDGTSSADRSKQTNYYISYYTLGAAVALALDLELRVKFNKSLDGYMQRVWQKFGKPEQPYTVDGLQEVLAAYSNNDFAAEFFSRYIYGHQPFDYQPALEQLGFILEPASRGQAWMGVASFKEVPDGLEIEGATRKGSPLANAGLDIGDVIQMLDGKEIRQEADLLQILKKHQPGDPLGIKFSHRGKPAIGSIQLEENPTIVVFPVRSASQKVTNNRDAWLGSKQQ